MRAAGAKARKLGTQGRADLTDPRDAQGVRHTGVRGRDGVAGPAPALTRLVTLKEETFPLFPTKPLRASVCAEASAPPVSTRPVRVPIRFQAKRRPGSKSLPRASTSSPRPPRAPLRSQAVRRRLREIQASSQGCSQASGWQSRASNPSSLVSEPVCFQQTPHMGTRLSAQPLGP